MLQIVLLVMGGAFLLNAIFLALTSNPHFGHVIQSVVALCIIVYGVIYKKISPPIHRLIRILCLLPMAVIIFLAVYGNHQTVDYQEDVLIVLGAGLNGEEVTPHLASRLDTAVAYFNQNPQVYIIVCGGLGEQQSITEAKAMERYLVERGVPTERIIREEQSTSTLENLIYAKEILNAQFPEDVRLALITNDFHIYRAISLAENLGLTLNHLGAPTPWMLWPLNYLRETLAVMRMWLF